MPEKDQPSVPVLWYSKVKLIKDLYYEVRGKAGAEEFDRRIRGWLNNYNRQLDRPAVASAKTAEAVNFCQEVLKHLNQTLGSEYTLLEDYEVKITYWFKQGKTLDDFFKVHKLKYAQWFDNDKMRPYLRPSTLYRKKHFDEYLQEANILLVKHTTSAPSAKSTIPQKLTVEDSKKHDTYVLGRLKIMSKIRESKTREEREYWEKEFASYKGEPLPEYKEPIPASPEMIDKLRNALGSIGFKKMPDIDPDSDDPDDLADRKKYGKINEG
jgi:uncharacterized phage protein (TIGR02220 family)